MFYGARTSITAVAETLEPRDERYAIAEFRTTRPITVLDLTILPYVSLFDVGRTQLYDWAVFMRKFAADFRTPVARDGSEHIEYVPTQVVTEYIRSAVRHNGRPLDGILYTSARRARETCVVLFAEQEDVAPEPDPGTTPADRGYLLALRHVSNCRRTL